MPHGADTGAKGRIDWGFVAIAAALVLMGTVAILSAASPLPYYVQVIKRHFIALGVGTFLFIVGLGFNYQVFEDQAKGAYALIVLMLLAVLFLGITQRGHRAWFQISFLTFQPAELARIGTILILAAYLDSQAKKIRYFSTILMGVAVAGPIMVLIIKQPDFSSALTFFPILLGMLFGAGADILHLLFLMGFGMTALATPLLYTFCQVQYPQAAAGSLPYFILQTSRMGLNFVVVLVAIAAINFLAWRLSIRLRLHLKAIYFIVIPVILSAGLISGILINQQLKSYQRNRFVAYVSPHADIQGAAYHVHQSRIAIGSGGVFGKGLFAGTQSQLGFLPERHTDFIYSVIGEEMGFVGTMGILGLYLLLIWRIVAIGKLARDRYGYLICCGLAAMFAFEIILNVGMCTGLIPVAGVPLPLISYGGSSLVITMWSLGIVANIYSRRYALL